MNYRIVIVFTPLLAALPTEPEKFAALWLETPDTNEGKTLSGFTRRFPAFAGRKTARWRAVGG
ncbi:MAG: hypothetical protein WDM70_10115 [Nitrosomonadales bacterium]